MDTDDPRIGLVLDDRYRIDTRLAAGGMGVVYRGERVGLAKPVAIKFLHRSAVMVPERLLRFQREAAVMSKLSHPNLMGIIDFGEHDGVPYLVMEFHDGVSLRDTLARGALPPTRAVYVARQIVAGLGSLHDGGVVHRDLKPANVMLIGSLGEDFVKILDFGLAKMLDSGSGPSQVSVVAGHVLGTPEYMAPEQARSQAVDARTDLYAVGIILYEMVVGRRPFEGDNDLAVLRQQVEDLPVPPRAVRTEISSELDAAILRALEKEPDQRWQTAQELGAALAALPEGSGAMPLRSRPQPAEPAPPRIGSGTSRAASGGRGRTLALLIVLLAVLGGGAWLAAAGLIELPWQPAAAPPPDAAPPDAAPPDAPAPDAPPPDAALMSPLMDAGDGGARDGGTGDAMNDGGAALDAAGRDGAPADAS